MIVQAGDESGLEDNSRVEMLRESDPGALLKVEPTRFAEGLDVRRERESRMTVNSKAFSYVCWPFVCLLRRSVYSCLLSIF